MSTIQDKYKHLFEFLDKTQMSSVIGSEYNSKILYKPILILAMINKNKEDWYKKITPEEVSEFFYTFHIENEIIKDRCFSSKEQQEWKDGQYISNKKKVEKRILHMPMDKLTTKVNDYSPCVLNKDTKEFYFDIDVPIEDKKQLMIEVLSIIEKKINDGIGDNAHISLETPDQEYNKIINLKENPYIDESTYYNVVKSRIGQGKYRSLLLSYRSECDICKMHKKDLLIASHIKPFKDCENQKEAIDPMNGLILCRNHDQLFDKGLITFDDNGNIIIPRGNNFDIYDAELLQLSSDIKINIAEENKKYLKYHRENVYLG